MTGIDELSEICLMIAVSTVVMYGLMYLNSYALDHVFFSQTRAWMALLIGAVMAVIMISLMWTMYGNQQINMAVGVRSVVAFALSLWLLRIQETVDDVSYMKAMIPHHSIVIESNPPSADKPDLPPAAAQPRWVSRWRAKPTGAVVGASAAPRLLQNSLDLATVVTSTRLRQCIRVCLTIVIKSV